MSRGQGLRNVTLLPARPLSTTYTIYSGQIIAVFCPLTTNTGYMNTNPEKGITYGW